MLLPSRVKTTCEDCGQQISGYPRKVGNNYYCLTHYQQRSSSERIANKKTDYLFNEHEKFFNSNG